MKRMNPLIAIALLVFIAVTFVKMGLDPIGYVLLGVFMLVLILATLRYYGVDLFRSRRVLVTAQNIDGMSGADFEDFCADLLRKNGFRHVTVTPASGDQGVDIIAEKNGQLYAVQCKRYSARLGNSPVQEVNAGRSVYHCDRAIVMTNNYFTPGAVQAARACGVELWDRDDLYAMLAAFDDD